VATSSNTLPNHLTLHRYRRTNKSYTETLAAGVTLTLMLIPAGEFMMGAPKDEPESGDDERPQHRVVVPQFLMGRYPVTQAQWRVVAGYKKSERDLDPNPSRFEGDNHPVEKVSWEEAQEFCQRLSVHSGKDYRLPSEAQWEYACRAGTTTPFHFGEMLTPELANYQTASSYNGSPTTEYRGETTDVGSFPANEWGLHDMHGNVWEWCEDDWHGSYANKPEALKQAGNTSWTSAETESRKVLRGGSWLYYPRYCRSADRFNGSRDFRSVNFGFRVCCVPPRILS
jgi:formylglycine-generating enzyme required for sulfatase activity